MLRALVAVQDAGSLVEALTDDAQVYGARHRPLLSTEINLNSAACPSVLPPSDPPRTDIDDPHEDNVLRLQATGARLGIAQRTGGRQNEKA